MVHMTSSETVRARRRAPWVDVRFLLGIVLILASVAGVWFVVSAARQTAPAIAAATTLVPGDVISATDVRVVEKPYPNMLEYAKKKYERFWLVASIDF